MPTRTTSILAGTAALTVAAVTGCTAAEDGGGESEATAAAEDCEVREHAMGVRWFQQSAEAKALQGQTYRLAEQRLDQLVEDAPEGEDLAIITDLDETTIDNSQLLARDMAECHDFSTWDTWGHWEQEGQPTLIPGALDFFERADELGVSIHYISDRLEENKDDTLATLEELDLPQVSEEQVQLLGPPKEERRADVVGDYEVLMQLGDTLHDFDAAFADADLETQRELVDEHAERFGDDWFVLPNPTYGSWEDAELEVWDAELEIEE